MCPTDRGSRAVPRWGLICDALDPDGRHHRLVNADSPGSDAPFLLSSSYDLEEAILRYNPHYKDKWNFRTLHSYFHEKLSSTEREAFFNEQLPEMVRLGLSLREVVTSPPPLLRKLRAQGAKRVTMSRQQAAALLVNAFFCTYPRRNAQSRNSEFASFPEINFNRLFATGNAGNKHEKLKTLLHYFRRVTEHPPLGTISFTRQKVTQTPVWNSSERKLPRLHVSSSKYVEEKCCAHCPRMQPQSVQ